MDQPICRHPDTTGVIMKTLLIASAFVAAAAVPLAAQHSGHGSAPAQPRAGHGGHGGHGAHGAHGGHASPAPQGTQASPPAAGGHAGHGAAQAQPTDPAAQAFAAANAKMHKDMAVPLTGNADVDFARGMIPHHQGAVEMAEIVLKFGKDAEVRALANAVIAAQKTEIAQMQGWLSRNAASAPGPRATVVKKAFEEANARMHAGMDLPPSGSADRDFMLGMIPHHEGAVEMAKIQLRHGADPDMRKLARDVVRTQSEEIASMLEWLSRNGG
jgi:uncharacterized protein (DUF305 family)